jgi:hypothetical protein
MARVIRFAVAGILLSFRFSENCFSLTTRFGGIFCLGNSHQPPPTSLACEPGRRGRGSSTGWLMSTQLNSFFRSRPPVGPFLWANWSDSSILWSTRELMQDGNASGSFCHTTNATSTVELTSKPCVISRASVRISTPSLARITGKLWRSGI